MYLSNCPSVDRGRVVGIVTGYGLGDLGIESRWGRDIPHPSRTALRPTQPPIRWVLDLFPGGKAAGACRWPPTPSTPSLRKSKPIPLLTLLTFVACSRVNFTLPFCNWTSFLFSSLRWRKGGAVYVIFSIWFERNGVIEVQMLNFEIFTFYSRMPVWH